jgi:hypothetical protein
MDRGETRRTSCKKIVVCELLVNPTTEQPFVMKATSIDFTLKSVSFYILGKLMPCPSNTVPFETIFDINSALDSFHRKKVCKGFKCDSSGFVK